MGTYGNLWELSAWELNAWELMGTYGNLWELMGTYDNLVRGNLWELTRMTTPTKASSYSGTYDGTFILECRKWTFLLDFE